jgi:antitoxin (DNA-binding transcriptional repressor) of toxin-antitoxin stability system
MKNTYNLPYARRNLSKLIDEVLGGAAVTIAVDGKPVVNLVRHQPQRKFVLGSLRHLIAYNMRDEEEKQYFAAER